jgi:uncharacterized SAM-binding protein YcdF (DUF218 family)
MRDVLKIWMVPGSLAFLMVMFVTFVLVILLAPRGRLLGTLGLGVLLLTYGLMSLPLVAAAIAGPLLTTASARDERLSSLEDAAAVVVLAGDNPSGRIAETLALFNRVQPRWVIASAPRSWAEDLRHAGVPGDRLLVESTAPTTRDQALAVQAMLTSLHVDRVFLVVSRLDMRRALGTFEALHCVVIPAPSPLDYAFRPTWAWGVLPQRTALRLSREALYEYGALIFYRWEGWTS